MLVRYKRLETTGSFCNVEVEVQRVFSSQFPVEKAMMKLQRAVDAEIVAAKKRHEEEIMGRQEAI